MKGPALTPRGRRYRGNDAVARMRQQAVFYNARRSKLSVRPGAFVVVNDADEPLCLPTSHEEAEKLSLAADGKVRPA